jgi:hypothetical protein
MAGTRSVGLAQKIPYEVVGVPLGVLAPHLVALLETTDEPLAVASDAIEIIVGQFGPRLADGTIELVPIALRLIPVHDAPVMGRPGPHLDRSFATDRAPERPHPA